MTQGVVVDQILVAQRQGEHALPDQGGQAVLDPVRRPMIDKVGIPFVPPASADIVDGWRS